MDKQEVCVQIVKSLENVWSENILYDFAVKVQDETIKCHRLILAAFSEFFKACFRSGMKEVTENCLVLKDVSCEVFHLILNTVYTGTSMLTLDNFIEVWRAAHMLQVKVMVNVCEEFAIGAFSLDTWENIYKNAKLLSSEKVLDKLHTFMLKNFEEIRHSTTFLQLSFNEVQDLIKSQDLVVSIEDVVFETVIKWVEYVHESQLNNNLLNDYNVTIINNNLKTEIALSSEEANDFKEQDDNHQQDNCLQILNKTKSSAMQVHTAHSVDSILMKTSRKDKLTELLMQVRTCLVSPAALFRVLKMRIFSEIEDSREVILDAMSYHVQDFRHGQWSSAAIHRSCSEYTNAGVYAINGGGFEIITANKEEQFYITKCKYLQESVQLVTFDGELYAAGSDVGNSRCRLFVYCDNSWKEVMEMPSHNLLFVAHGDFIYIINKDDKVIYSMNPKKREPKLEKIKDFPSNDVDVKHAMALENALLLFCAESIHGIEKTAVYQFEISSKLWTTLDNIDGPATQLISFKNDQRNYILQTDGSLSLGVYSSGTGNIEFKFLAKLWNFTKRLFGGLTFQNKLIILGNYPRNDPPNEKKTRSS